MIGAIGSISVIGVTNSGGDFQIQVSVAGVVGGTVTIAGCRNASGALVAGLNGTYTATPVDSTHFTIPVAYASGYSFGGTVWYQGGGVTSTTLTAFDSVLATRVADKTGDVLFGQYTFTGNPSVAASGVGSKVVTTVPGALIQTTSSGVKYQLGDGDDVQLLPPRSRSILVSLAEVFNQYGIEGAYFGQTLTAAMGVSSTSDGVSDTSVKTFWVPLTRMHDKATLLRATLYFFPNPALASGFVLPTTFPNFTLYRINPSTDVVKTPMAVSGTVSFPASKSAAAYAVTAAVGSSGTLPLVTLNGGTAVLSAGQQLVDAAGNLFQVSASGTYSSGVPVPIAAVAPASPAVFYGANTNYPLGESLTWTPSAPSNCVASQVSGPLTGGLNAGYAQSIVFVPDPAMAVIDQSAYQYFAVITDDNVATSNALGSASMNTMYTAIKLDFADITALTPQ